MKKENRQKAKELRAKQKAQAEKRARIKAITIVMIPIVLVALLIGGLLIWYAGLKTDTMPSEETEGTAAADTQAAGDNTENSNTENSSTEKFVDYGAYLTEDGMIADIDIEECVELFDYRTLQLKKEDVEPSDKDVEDAIAETLKSLQFVAKDSSLIVKSGDTVNIDYTGYVDGEKMENGSTEGKGTSLQIGSKQYIDGFEDGLIGAKPGDSITLNLTFPNNYHSADLQGKDVRFDVTVNGIYQIPELTDELVKEKLAEYADSAEAYVEYTRNQLYEKNVQTAATDKIINGSTIKAIPEDYYNNLFEVYVYEYAYAFKYANEQYYKTTGSYRWENPYEYYGVTEDEYKKRLSDAADSNAMYFLVAQAIHENEKLPTMNKDDLVAYMANNMGYTEDNIETMIKVYGEPYMYQRVLAEQAFRHAVDQIEIVE